MNKSFPVNVIESVNSWTRYFYVSWFILSWVNTSLNIYIALVPEYYSLDSV